MKKLTSIEILEDNAGYNNTLGLSWRDPVTGELKGVVIAWDSDETAGVRVGDNAIGIPEELAAQIDWDSAEFFVIPDGGSRNWSLENKLGDLAGGGAKVFTIHNAGTNANRDVKFSFDNGWRTETISVASAQGFDVLFQSEDKNPGRTDSDDPNDSDYAAGDGDETGDPDVNEAPDGETDVSDGFENAGFEAEENQMVLGFEDLVWGSDNDFNDLIIRATFEEEEEEGVPGGSDGTDDLVVWTPADGSGVSDGGSGFDIFEADLSGVQGGITIGADGGVITIGADGATVELINYEEIRIILGDDGNTVIISGDFSQTGLSEDTIIVVGGTGDDNIDASAVFGQNVELYGQGGNDTLSTGNGDDLIDGGDGNDILSAGAGDDTLIGGSGADTFIIGGGSDTIADFSADDGDLVDLSVFGLNATILGSIAPDPSPIGNHDAMVNGFVNANGDFIRFEFSPEFALHIFSTFEPGFNTDTEDTSDDLTFTVFDADNNALGTVTVLGVDTQEEFVEFFLGSVI